MKTFTLHRLLGATLLVAVCHGNAGAFYVNGLMSGMSSATAQKILQKHGFAVMETPDDGSVVARDNQDNRHTLIAFFCEDRLVQVQNNFEPSFSKFVTLVEQQKKEFGTHGSARVAAASAGSKNQGDSVSFTWQDKETTIEVLFAESAGGRQVSVFHRIKSSCR